MTVLQLIESSLRKLSVLSEGESASTAQISDGLTVLNQLLYRWSALSLGIHKTTIVSHTLTEDDGEYTIGATGDITEDRPIRIVGAYLRRDSTDYTVDITDNTTMDSIPRKSTASIVWRLRYEPTYPNGTITVYPVPDNSTDVLYLRLWQPLAVYTASTETIALPPEYHSPLQWNHARDYASEFSLPVPENVAVRSQETFGEMKNLHRKRPAQLNTNPAGIGRKYLDITTGGYYY